MIRYTLETFAHKIQWLINNDKISAAQLNEYNKIIQDIQAEFNTLLTMNNEKDWAIARQRDQIQHLKGYILHLQAICLLHGINDLAVWIAKPTGLIINLLYDSQKNGWAQMPEAFNSSMNFSKFVYYTDCWDQNNNYRPLASPSSEIFMSVKMMAKILPFM